MPVLSVQGTWEEIFEDRQRKNLESLLPHYLRGRRWFGGKARRIDKTLILDTVPVPFNGRFARIFLIRVFYADDFQEVYVLPLTFAVADTAERIKQESPDAVLAELQTSEGRGVLFDAVWDKGFSAALLDSIARNRRFRGNYASIAGSATRASGTILQARDSPRIRVLRGEQSNTSVLFENKVLLKLFRRAAAGVNPDLEVGRFLTEKAHFPNIPAVLGALEYLPPDSEPMTLAVLHAYVENRGDAWQYTLDYLEGYLNRAVARGMGPEGRPVFREGLAQAVEKTPPPPAQELFGDYLNQAGLLGQRTAEFHLALASDPDDPAFAPEPFTDRDREYLYRSMSDLCRQVFQSLRDRQLETADPVRIPDLEEEILRRFERIMDVRLTGSRIRIHGDYHLGQVLYTGEDFFLIDFEGEPARPLSERRMKTSVFRDVCGMLRSFHYASFAGALALERGPASRPLQELEPWWEFWYRWTGLCFLKSYLQTCGDTSFLPEKKEEIQVLVDAFMLEKAVYELGYELNNRPDWVAIPVRGILDIIEQS